MGANGSVLLGEVAERASHIDVACSRCDRKGRYRLAKLVAEFGPEFQMTNLGAELASCPRRGAAVNQKRCDIYYPGLVKIMSDDEPPPSLESDDLLGGEHKD
jgi:hypothetical protein